MGSVKVYSRLACSRLSDGRGRTKKRVSEKKKREDQPKASLASAPSSHFFARSLALETLWAGSHKRLAESFNDFGEKLARPG